MQPVDAAEVIGVEPFLGIVAAALAGAVGGQPVRHVDRAGRRQVDVAEQAGPMVEGHRLDQRLRQAPEPEQMTADLGMGTAVPRPLDVGAQAAGITGPGAAATTRTSTRSRAASLS